MTTTPMSRTSPLAASVTVAPAPGTDGRLTLYRTGEDGMTVPLTLAEVAALVEQARARRRRLFTTRPAPARLALLLGRTSPASEVDLAAGCGPLNTS
ncbi:hypothetical protein ACWD4N_48735 [Streptomyces sp. NPDC002586]